MSKRIDKKQQAQVTAVILAAGQSSRMGRPKQIEIVDGVPMVVRAANVALASAATDVVVVTGAYVDEVTAQLEPFVQEHRSRLRMVHNADWVTGQASSVRAAVAHLRQWAAALLFLPVDQPFLPATLLDQLITAWQTGASLVAPAVDGQVRGAPAIFDQALFPELLALHGDTGARPLFQRHREQLATVPADAAWLRDIDTPDDLINSSYTLNCHK